MEIRESQPKGLRSKFEIDIASDDEVIVTVQKSGHKDIFLRESPGEDAEKLVSLTDKEARMLGAILIGAYSEPDQINHNE